jgi:hypothetical protein
MNVEALLKWADALESGQYEQGHNYLTQDRLGKGVLDCCLGVACKVAMLNGITLKTQELQREGRDGTFKVTQYETQTWHLPNEVLKWLEIGQNQEIEINGIRARLIIHNDERHASFQQIAQGIRALVKEYQDNQPKT